MKYNFLKLSLVLLLLPLTSCGSSQPNEVDLSGYTKEAQSAIKDFVKQYGHTDNAYIVSDFDNTTAVFDIAYQCSVYQIETMSFAMAPSEIKEVLLTSLEKDEVVNNYADDIEDAYTHLYTVYGPFTASGVSDNKLEELHSNTYYQEFSTKLKCFYNHVEEIVEDEVSLKWIMYWFTNMNENEVYSLFKRSCEKYQYEDTKEVTWTSPSSINSKIGVTSCSFITGCSVTSSVKNMLKYYADNGIDTWICSASHVDGVRAAVDAFGLSDRITGVVGMTQKMNDGKFVPDYDYETGYPYLNKGNGVWEKTNLPIKALPSREGKVNAIKNALLPRYANKGPLAGFMDASGDFNFCTEFSSLKMVICYNRANRKITEGGGLVAIAAMYQKTRTFDLASCNQGGDTYYLLQGRDENGKRTLREYNETIRFKETEPKLFANEDNMTLFNYATTQVPTIKEYFDTFAIKTDAEHSVIGVPYGFLSTYNGYHSIN